MQKNVIRSNALKRATALFTSLSLACGCTMTQATGPNAPQIKGTVSTVQKAFHTQSGPYCPIPSSVYPTAFTQVSGSGTSVLSTRYGSGPSPFSFFYGGVTFKTDSAGFLKLDIVMQGNSGPNYYTIETTALLPVKDLDNDLHTTISTDMTYSSSNDTAVLLYPGTGAVAVEYQASTGLWTIGVSGHGDVIPRDSVYGGTADYLASATLETGVCHPPTVDLTAMPEYISPANGDGKFDVGQFHVKSTSSSPWTLTIQGNKPGPVDSRGLPTKGAVCTWSTTGSDPDTTVGWDGTCSDRTPMVDGQYEAKLESAGAEARAQIKIDNTPPIIGTPVLTLAPDNDIRYDANVEDPEVNGVASGLSNDTLNLGVTVNGQPVAITGAGLSISGTGANQHSTLSFTAPPMPGAALNIAAEDNVANRNNGNLPTGCNPNQAPVLLPQDLNDLLTQLQNLNLADPDAVQNLQQIRNQLANLESQLGAAGFSTQSFHTQATGQTAQEKKIQNLLAKREAARQELEAAQDAMDAQLAPLDGQLQQLVSLVENHYDFRLHKYQGVYLPTSLEQYKNKVDRAESIFHNLAQSGNTYNFLFAGFITILETQLYRMLLDDFISGDLQATSSNDEAGYSYHFAKVQNVNSAKQLITLLANRIQSQQAKLTRLQGKLQTRLDKVMTNVLNKTPYAALLAEALTANENPDEFESASTFFQTQSVGDFSIKRSAVADDTLIEGGPSGGLGGTGGLPVGEPGTGGGVGPGAGAPFNNAIFEPPNGNGNLPPGMPVTEAEKFRLFQTALSLGGKLADWFDQGYRAACNILPKFPTFPSAPPTRPVPQPTNVYPSVPPGQPQVTRDSHSEDLRANLGKQAKPCVAKADENKDPLYPHPEDAHHIVPLGYRPKGMDFIQSLLNACEIDIDDAENGVCLDTPTHKQTFKSSPTTDNNYVQQIMIKLSIGVYDPVTNSVNCDELHRRLELIKSHLMAQNKISQGGGTPTVDLGSISF